MIKCPNCGSAAQVCKYDWDIHFDNDEEITIYQDCLCKGCSHLFRTERLYRADGWEMVCEEDE